ncbi:hypothetical protein CI102_6845 [Trichoderma harzianum]|uniref:Uncharacterized protein n=1 Tax=Trichoderma harzianum CBS 226.95 TaxID=983964 RepID=A0A2T4AEG7_TRIHA|nr:hypothetical protein M431DRAFT_83695 [Trichoderma harzianum CBS 226.95]PKK50284.1 hypothetical protein CI102_6845 [Trichoderma harzianum]PTB55467.1 hypothetical protein M431DRAFT_83695 [Trichoderma harzianum CBS 226.95]
MNNLVIYILDKGYDASAENEDISVTTAVFRRHIDTLQLLLRRGANVESIGLYEDRTALHIAVKKDTTITRILLENGANPNAHSVGSGTPLAIASFYDNESAIELLIKYKADINCVGVPKYGSALCAAASNCSLRASIGFLVEETGDDINTTGGFYGSALQAASSKGYVHLVEMLLRNGALINAKGGRCGTALQAASYHGHVSVVYWLLENGADVNQMGGLYGTALQAAAFNGHADVAELLLERGADINLEGGKYNTALDAAKQRKLLCQRVRKFLLSRGAVDHGLEYTYNSADDSDNYDRSSDRSNSDEDEEESV